MSLNIACWNCRGVMTATPYISKLLHDSKVDILCLSEHWLRKCQFNFSQSIEQNYSAYGKGVDEHCPGNLMVSNRGGVAVLVSDNLATYVTEIEVDSTRICGIELKLPNSTSIFFLCVYLPAITQPFEHFVNETEYLFDIYNSYSQHGTVFFFCSI